MTIGFDVDGVLADFVRGYQSLFVKITGRNAFEPGDDVDPPTWDWPSLRGYTKEETSAVWDAIRQDPTFWLNLEAERSGACSTLSTLLPTLERKHSVYFITSRVGDRVKRQTEIWLDDHLAYSMRAPGFWPTVVIVGHRVKGQVANALKLDAYIDDNLDNAKDCARDAAMISTYLLNRAYNQSTEDKCYSYRRINTVGEMFDAEIAKGRL